MTTPSPLSICVYCGSRNGDDPAYTAAAKALGQGIAQRGMRLVYGAGDVGLMGEVARTAQEAGADVFGVIPEHLRQWEVGKSDLTSFVVTETMHERKKVMFMNSDVVVVLPGGAGSLDEFFEVLTWAQLKLHKKPIWILNIGSYWDPLVALIDHVIDRGFADASLRDFYKVSDSVESLFNDLVPK
ncbi:MAG: TIGR00730 family Rossman fold protein [Pseudomonadota bacterium]